jgi:ArsR family metal-binding transcriptional regulator
MSDQASALLHHYAVTRVLDCIADPSRHRAIAEFSDDVSPVFPYLNAVFAKLAYNPGANALSIKRSGRLMTVYPRGATLAKVEDRKDAEALLRWFQELCNDVWRRRADITPCYEPRKTVDPIDIYQLLPGLNCRECGQASCWAFSWELLFGDQTLDSCPLLSSPDYVEAGRRLEELIGGNGIWRQEGSR